MSIPIRKAVLLLVLFFSTADSYLHAQSRQQLQAQVDSLNKQHKEINDKDSDHAEKLANEALHLALESGYLWGEVSARSNLSVTYFNKGNYTKSIEECFSALKIYDREEKFKNTYDYGMTFIRLAAAFHLEGDYSRSIVYLHMAVSVAKKIQDQKLLAIAYGQLGMNYADRHLFDSALYHYNTAKNTYTQIGYSKGIAVIENNTGEIYFNKGNYQVAIAHFSGALTIDKKNNEYISYTIGFKNIGEAYYKLKSYTKAINYLDSAEAYAKTFKTQRTLLGIYYLKAQTYQAIGNLDSCAQYYEKTLTLKDSTYNETYKKELAALQTQSDVYKKETENQLLTKDKRIAVLYRDLAVAGIVGLVILLGFILLNQRLRIQRRVKDQLEEEVVLRTKEIFRQKETIFHTNLRLKLALNGAKFDSHFAVNVLNAIQQAILNQNPQEAQDHLAKLAYLMQYVLEKSPLERVPLTEELQMIEHYIQLEQLRLNHRFTYSITVNTDAANTTIPALLLQPYIENAIQQGLAPADGNQLHLHLQVETEGEQLAIAITDNGQDRRKEKRNKQHLQGCNIGQERLDLLTHLTHKNHLVYIEELVTQNGSGAGTKMVLQLPIEGQPILEDLELQETTADSIA